MNRSEPHIKRRESVAQNAYEVLRHEILSGSLPVSERLTEVELATRLGVSRTPVREAVKRLLLEGLLTRDSGPGLRVANMPLDEVEQVFDIRLLLESYAARRAAIHASDDERRELHVLARRMADHIPPRNDDGYRTISEANSAFHQLILQAARSPRLVAMLSVTMDLALVQRTFRIYSETDLRRSAAHHQEIADAISARAPDWAAAAMTAHLLAAVARSRNPQGVGERS